MADAFTQLGDDYISATLAQRPEAATTLGIHEHDASITDRSRDHIDRRARELRAFLSRIDALDGLTAEDGTDAELLRNHISWELVTIEEIAAWRHNPGGYLAAIGGGCNGLIIRDFAPLAERARSLIARLRQAPRLLEQARTNLEECSRIHVETALEQGAGLRVLLQRDLPDALAPLDDASLLAEFGEALRTASEAIDGFLAWMKDDLLPKAHEDFAYGPERYRKMLSQLDAVERPLEELERRGREDLRACQERLRELAAQVDASKPAAEVVDLVAQEHPAPERLLPDTDALLEELRRFSIEHRLATMPTEVRIRVAETPSFARSTTQAACSTPGAFEKVATEAYYYVTPPDASWPAERTEAYLKFFNRYSLPGITAHEAYPGHYVHLMWLHSSPRRLPHFLPTITAIEGWAHYVELLMIEAGYGDGNPRYGIMQQREALMRLCRYLASLGMHTQGWTFEQSVAFFLEEGYSTQPIAERESRRGVIGPQYYSYTLGKHEILDLREKVRRRQGSRYDQLAFHDAFMKLPYPVPVIERLLLANET